VIRVYKFVINVSTLGKRDAMKLRIRAIPLFACAMSAVILSGCSSEPAKTDAPEAAAPAAADASAAAPAAPAADASAAAPAAAVTFASLTGDAAKGKTVFAKCMACHVLKEGENRVGPSLHGIIGRTAGQVAGFSYSAANKNSGIVWTKEKLYDYLEAPQKMVVGTKMAFAGLASPQDRADIIAYLDEND
jgi:cytochrome c